MKYIIFFLLTVFLYCNNNDKLKDNNLNYSFIDSSKIYKKNIDSLNHIIKKLSVQDSLLVDTLKDKINLLKKKIFYSPIKKSGLFLKILSVYNRQNKLYIRLYVKNLFKKQLILRKENFLIMTNIKSIKRPIDFDSVYFDSGEGKEFVIMFAISDDFIDSFNIIIPENNIVLRKRYNR